MLLNADSLAMDKGEFQVIAIGASLGGLKAIRQLLSVLPPDFPVPIVVVQHLQRTFPSQFAQLLDQQISLSVKWAEHEEPLKPGWVYLAPPDHHLEVNSNGQLLVSQTPRIQFARPSVNKLFESVANNYGEKAIGVILTGMGQDGAKGVQSLKKRGGRVLVQDLASCQSPSMPIMALRTGCVDFTLPIKGISAALITLVMVPGAASLFTVSPAVA